MALLTPQFFQIILAVEGGFQALPDDNGNYACGQLIGTNMGVSAVAFSQWVGRCPSVQEMKNLDKQTAFNFYAWYFDTWNLYPVENQKFFELLANNTMGSPAGASRAEQRALNRMGFSVAVDGKRGSATVSALNQAWRQNPAKIYNLVREEWVNHLQSINKPQFLAGWMARINKYFPPLPMGGGSGPWAMAAVAVMILTLLNSRK